MHRSAAVHQLEGVQALNESANACWLMILRTRLEMVMENTNAMAFFYVLKDFGSESDMQFCPAVLQPFYLNTADL